MATVVTSSIGTTGRTYSTLQSWEDACPANLVTDDKIWKGECYNDSEFTAVLTISGMTVDATRYVELTAAAGQSFQDHADVRTNPLRYDQSKGVGIRTTAEYLIQLTVSADYTIVRRLQVQSVGKGSPCIHFTVGNCILENVLAIALGLQAASAVIFYSAAGNQFRNVVAIQLRSDAYGMGGYFSQTLIGCTVLKPSDITAGGVALRMQYGNTGLVRSCAFFGFTTLTDGSGTYSASSGYNATDLSSGLPGSNNQHSVTYNQTTPFTDADKDSLDLRAIAATSLAGNGYLDSTNAPNDISGTARAVSPTIGAWELAAAAAAYVFGEIPRGILRGVQRGMTRMHG